MAAKEGMRRSALWAVGGLLVGLVAIAGAPRGSGAADELNRITRVQPGMTMLQVLQTLGPPNDIVGHAFLYKNLGKVVFASGGSPLDKTKVEKVEPSLVQQPVP
jgi:hypothetical protein